MVLMVRKRSVRGNLCWAILSIRGRQKGEVATGGLLGDGVGDGVESAVDDSEYGEDGRKFLLSVSGLSALKGPLRLRGFLNGKSPGGEEVLGTGLRGGSFIEPCCMASCFSAERMGKI